MTSRALIQFNYQEALKRADEVDDIASELNRAMGTLNDTMLEVSNSWKGDSATQYEKKGDMLSQRIKNSAQDLRDTAREIRRIAEIIRKTEMHNLEIAEQRNF